MLVRDTRQMGAVLQRERKRQGLTQTELGEKAGLRQQTISAIERGKPRSELQGVLDLIAALGLEVTLQPRSAEDIPDIEDIF